MIAQRALAVAAAVLLVAAVAIATFGAQSLSLGQALFLLDDTSLDKLLAWSNHVSGNWLWGSVVQPLLVRPAWLIPASAGIVCSGLSFSLSHRKSPHRSHRRS
ncbi:hypothetical protein [Rhodopila sp.]|uniref:hypothetical protein n=1 Tax=Rhodopila sp. TaxID=2480087 RepID=UPI003D12FBC3